VALEYLRELSDLTKAQQHEQLRQQLQRVGMVPGDDDAEQRLQQKAWDLADQVRRKEEVLVESAVRAALASGYDARRPFRVAKLAELFAMHEGTGSETVAQWKLAALLADIGMVAIPARLIARKGSLAADERALVHEHVRYGAQLVGEAGLAKHRPCIELIRSHHERWDGSGPLQLRAADNPPGAQVIALADAYDALTHDRPWRRAKTVQEAVFEIGEAAANSTRTWRSALRPLSARSSGRTATSKLSLARKRLRAASCGRRSRLGECCRRTRIPSKRRLHLTA
jgi:HD-GYP domain-containing protein (c-di-GMP phosphodiesterase class II)